MQFNKQTALLLIDLQKGFEDINYWGGGRNNLQAEANAAKILTYWREQQLPGYHIKHCSLTPESPLVEGKIGNEFIDSCKPMGREPVYKKHVNSAFIGTSLKEDLENAGIDTLVIVGLTTDHCISTSTRMAGNFGFITYLIEDAVATFDKIGVNGEKYPAQLIHDTALASLNGEFAKVIGVEELMGAL
jgi:nicotinamidase-related amidase